MDQLTFCESGKYSDMKSIINYTAHAMSEIQRKPELQIGSLCVICIITMFGSFLSEAASMNDHLVKSAQLYSTRLKFRYPLKNNSAQRDQKNTVLVECISASPFLPDPTLSKQELRIFYIQKKMPESLYPNDSQAFGINLSNVSGPSLFPAAPLLPSLPVAPSPQTAVVPADSNPTPTVPQQPNPTPINLVIERDEGASLEFKATNAWKVIFNGQDGGNVSLVMATKGVKMKFQIQNTQNTKPALPIKNSDTGEIANPNSINPIKKTSNQFPFFKPVQNFSPVTQQQTLKQSANQTLSNMSVNPAPLPTPQPPLNRQPTSNIFSYPTSNIFTFLSKTTPAGDTPSLFQNATTAPNPNPIPLFASAPTPKAPAVLNLFSSATQGQIISKSLPNSKILFLNPGQHALPPLQAPTVAPVAAPTEAPPPAPAHTPAPAPAAEPAHPPSLFSFPPSNPVPLLFGGGGLFGNSNILFSNPPQPQPEPVPSLPATNSKQKQYSCNVDLKSLALEHTSAVSNFRVWTEDVTVRFMDDVDLRGIDIGKELLLDSSEDFSVGSMREYPYQVFFRNFVHNNTFEESLTVLSDRNELDDFTESQFEGGGFTLTHTP